LFTQYGVIFFYELLFVLVARRVLYWRAWSPTRRLPVPGRVVLFVVVGSASFDARLATTDGMSDDDRRFFHRRADGLRHLCGCFFACHAGRAGLATDRGLALSSASTAANVGMAGWAPRRVVARAPAAQPSRRPR